MTYITLKYPLENWWDHAILTMMFVAAWFGLDKMLIKKPAAKTYHGAALLIPGYDSGKYQQVLAAAIQFARGERTAKALDPAAFIQKVREWTDYNASRGKADTRPYYSYQDWCDEEFPHHNFASMQRLVKSLEKGEGGLGLLITEQDSENEYKKRYAVDESAVNALVDQWAAAHPEAAKKFRGESRRLVSKTPRLEHESEGLAFESHKVVKKAFKQSSINGASPKSTGPLARNDKGSLEGPSVDSGSHRKSDLLQRLAEQQDTPEGERKNNPIPHSEAPLTQIDPVLDQPLSASTKMTPREVWKTSHHQLSLLFDRASFDMWLKNARLLAYENGVYRVSVPTAHAMDMLQYRYYRKIQRVFEGLQNTSVQIKFEVQS